MEFVCSKPQLTEWISEPPDDEPPQPGVHYRVCAEALAGNNNYIVYPETEALATVRHCWIMERVRRPLVPEPTATPMPDREPHEEDRARLFSVYLRPWVLAREDATVSVPHITDLDRPLPAPALAVEADPCDKRRRVSKKTSPEGIRSYQAAWASYVRGRIVSMHARRIIVQFMAACCGKSSRHEGNDTQRGREPDEEERRNQNDMNLEQVHAVICATAKKQNRVL